MGAGRNEEGAHVSQNPRGLPGQATLIASWQGLAELSPGARVIHTPTAVAAVFPSWIVLNNAIATDGADSVATTAAQLTGVYVEAGVNAWALWLPSRARSLCEPESLHEVGTLKRDITTLVMRTTLSNNLRTHEGVVRTSVASALAAGDGLVPAAQLTEPDGIAGLDGWVMVHDDLAVAGAWSFLHGRRLRHLHRRDITPVAAPGSGPGAGTAHSRRRPKTRGPDRQPAVNTDGAVTIRIPGLRGRGTLRRMDSPMTGAARPDGPPHGDTMNHVHGQGTTPWPSHLQPGAVRWARTSSHYKDTIKFYRDVMGLPVVGEFTASFGEEGTIFGLPDTSVQLEIVRARSGTGADTAVNQLVFYLDSTEAVTTATAPLRQRGLEPNPRPPGYWAANGAVIFSDPDGRSVVFAPWVYGRDPDPIDRGDSTTDRHHPGDEVPVRIDWYDGDRSALRPLFAQAEDSVSQLDGYITTGRVLVALYGPDIGGHLQLTATSQDGEVEIKNMAVAGERRGRGVGRALIEAAVRACVGDGAAQLVVATAAADIGNLRFYQRCGFRFMAIERERRLHARHRLPRGRRQRWNSLA